MTKVILQNGILKIFRTLYSWEKELFLKETIVWDHYTHLRMLITWLCTEIKKNGKKSLNFSYDSK